MFLCKSRHLSLKSNQDVLCWTITIRQFGIPVDVRSHLLLLFTFRRLHLDEEYCMQKELRTVSVLSLGDEIKNINR